MKIEEFGAIQLNRTDARHYGNGKIVPLTKNLFGDTPVSGVKGVSEKTQATQIQRAESSGGRSFRDYLIEAVNSVNSQQVQVSALQEKIITNPEDVDIHDVTIAMQKARMSLNLAQTVIDRLITGWNEITTTR